MHCYKYHFCYKVKKESTLERERGVLKRKKKKKDGRPVKLISDSGL